MSPNLPIGETTEATLDTKVFRNPSDNAELLQVKVEEYYHV